MELQNIGDDGVGGLVAGGGVGGKTWERDYHKILMDSQAHAQALHVWISS